MRFIYRARQKSNPLGKILYLWILKLCEFGRIYLLQFQSLQIRIQSTYSANFIKITNTVQQIQQFKLESSFFKWTCIFRKSYLITNQTLHNFFVNSNKCQLPSRYLNWVFKVSASCNNTKSKYLPKLQGCLIGELLWQIIPYWSKAVFSSAMLVGFGVCPSIAPHIYDI